MNTLNKLFRRFFPGVKVSSSTLMAPLVAAAVRRSTPAKTSALTDERVREIWDHPELGWGPFSSSLHFAADRQGWLPKVRQASQSGVLQNGLVGQGPYVQITDRISFYKSEDEMESTTHTVCVDHVPVCRVGVRSWIGWSITQDSRDWHHKCSDRISDAESYLQLPPPIRIIFDAVWLAFIEWVESRTKEWGSPPPDHPVSKLNSL